MFTSAMTTVGSAVTSFLPIGLLDWVGSDRFAYAIFSIHLCYTVYATLTFLLRVMKRRGLLNS
jgi:hypothetical protein